MLKRFRRKLGTLSVRSKSTSEKKDKASDRQPAISLDPGTDRRLIIIMFSYLLWLDAENDEHNVLDIPLTTSTGSPVDVVASDAPTASVSQLWTPSLSVTGPPSPSSNPPPSPILEPVHTAALLTPATEPTPPKASPTACSRVKPTPSPTSPAPVPCARTPLTSCAPKPPINIREYPWREQRFSSRAIPASIMHSYKPGLPKPRSKTKLTSPPPELLLAVFAYLQGDPTRPANVDYRGASDEPDKWYSHDWSLMQVSRTCRYLHDTAGTLLYSRAALLHEEDFARIARLPERMRARIRHLTVSITALEQLYIYLCALATSSPAHLTFFGPAFPHVSLFSPPSSLPETKRYLRGTPFAPCFSPTQLVSLTLFRPRGTRIRSGDAVGPGFAEFSSLHIRDPRGVWPGAASMDLDMTSVRMLEWDIVLPPPRFEPGLRVLTLGKKHVPSALPAGLRSLKTKASVPSPAWPLPTTLETLHVLRPHGLCAPCVRALALPRLGALRELRIALVSLAVLESLVLPPGLCILQLHLPVLPAGSSLTRILEPLVQLRLLSVVLPPSVSRSPSPTRKICETADAHAAHVPLASALLASVCTLREIHFGAGDLEPCVWGRLGEDDVVWLSASERTLLE